MLGGVKADSLIDDVQGISVDQCQDVIRRSRRRQQRHAKHVAARDGDVGKDPVAARMAGANQRQDPA